MSTQGTMQDVAKALMAAGPYPLAAYQFVQDGLRATVERVHDQADSSAAGSRHVSGQQLCMGLRDFAIEQYGYMAPVVLASWHIHRTEDFGRMVFALIEVGAMSKTAQDTLDDFRGVYDFSEAFCPESLAGALRSTVTC
jgi:uncharacterized repeat protein (TIGR04138 family)